MEKQTRNYQRIISWIAGILTLCLTVFSFTLSFETLTDLAKQNGIPIPALFPLIVEAAVIVFSLVTLSRSMRGLPTKYNWALIIGSSLLAGFFNITHAYPNYLSMFMGAMPSLFLLLSFESFLGLLKITIDKKDVTHELVQTITQLKEEVLQSNQKIAKLTVENVTLKNNKDVTNSVTSEKKNVITNEVQKRRQKVLKMLQQNVTPDEIADKLKVSKMTISRDIKTLNGSIPK